MTGVQLAGWASCDHAEIAIDAVVRRHLAGGQCAGACLAVAWLITAEQETEPASDLSTAFRAATRLPVLICYVTLALPLIAFFALLSYAVPLLADFGGVPLVAVPLILFVLGLASFFGSLIGG